jgi:hypothetical protein
MWVSVNNKYTDIWWNGVCRFLAVIHYPVIIGIIYLFCTALSDIKQLKDSKMER